jgi:hypothetical protein
LRRKGGGEGEKGTSVFDPHPRYACRYEFGYKLIDVVAHRTRLAFLNAREAYLALPYVAEVMAEELGWDEARKKEEMEEGTLLFFPSLILEFVLRAPSHLFPSPPLPSQAYSLSTSFFYPPFSSPLRLFPPFPHKLTFFKHVNF